MGRRNTLCPTQEMKWTGDGSKIFALAEEELWKPLATRIPSSIEWLGSQ